MTDLGQGIVAEIKGVPVGTGVFWPYGEDVASLGMTLVAPDWQQRGFGHRIMRQIQRVVANGRPLAAHGFVQLTKTWV